MLNIRSECFNFHVGCIYLSGAIYVWTGGKKISGDWVWTGTGDAVTYEDWECKELRII